MDKREFDEIIALGREQRGIEFKHGGSRKDKRFLAKVIRAVISMANRRDGGKVIIGVDEDENNEPIPNGVKEKYLDTWAYDDFADSVAEYANPGVSFDIEILSSHGTHFVIIEVREFEDFPVICKKSYDDILRSGACYVRPRRKPETVDIPTYADMRDLLEIAIDKGVRKFIRRASKAGIDFSKSEGKESDTEKYNKQISDFLGENK